MGFKITYTTLFEVQLLHNYFLNDGGTTFASMDPAEQETQLGLYDISEFIDIIPSVDTATIMNGHKIVAKTTKSGLAVYCKVSEEDEDEPFITLEDELQLTFILKLKDSIFSNYTELDFSQVGPFYFGNVRPDTEPNTLGLITLENQNTLIDDDFRLSEDGADNLLASLTDFEARGLFGVIQLSMIGDTADVSILENDGSFQNDHKVYKVHFDNRKTLWRYISSSDNSTVFTTAATQPLTKYGYVEILDGTDSYPNPSASSIIIDNSDIFSEVYI